MATSTVNTSTIVNPPSISSSSTRSVSPDSPPTNAGQPAASGNTFSHMQPGPTPVARGDADADFDLLSNNTNLAPIRERVKMPDISALGPKKS